MPQQRLLTLADSLYLRRLCFVSSLSETMFGVWGSILIESNHGPRLYPDRAANILRVSVGSLVIRWFGPIRANWPELVSVGRT